MSFVSTSAPPTLTSLHGLSFSPHRRRRPGRPSLFSLAVSNPRRPDASGPLLCRASKSQGSPVKKRQSSGTGKRKKKSGDARDVEVVDDFVIGEDEGERSSAAGYHPTPLPKPPAGFVVDDQGRVVMASDKRLVTIVDPTNNFPLECVIRRIFRSSSGDECMLLCPADTPVQILKSTNIDGWSAVSDEDVESILPTAAFALAKIHMHLVYSGFCYTARGGFCYSEDDIFDFRTGNGFFSEPVYLAHINAYKIMLMQVPASPANLASQYVAYASLAPFVTRDGHADIADDGQDVDGLPTEGVEITCFHMDGAHYMIYTPSDPLLFVAVKDHNRHLQIADDDLLEDPCIISAIDEETEFNALVEEEAALLESLMGER